MKQMKIRLHTAFFQHKSGVKSLKVLKSLNCEGIYLISFGLCMCLNLPNVIHLSLRLVVFCIFKRENNTVCFGGKSYYAVRES